MSDESLPEHLTLRDGEWDDYVVPPDSIKAGATSPGWAPFLAAGNLNAWAFDGTGARTEEVEFTIQLPHGWVEGTPVKIHVHFAPTTADAGNVEWSLEYSIADAQSDDTPWTASQTITSTPKAAGGIAWLPRIGAFAELDMTGRRISALIKCRLFRAGAAGSDTYGHDVSLTSVDMHYRKNSAGSWQEYRKR